MSDLTAQIDRAKSTAMFFGPGTFQAKERIKQLGKARWQGDKKSWLVSDFNLTDSQLEALFPDITIEEVDSGKEKSSGSENKVSPSPKKAPKFAVSPGAEIEGSKGALSVPEVVNLARAAVQSAFPEVIHVYGVLQSVKRYGERVYMNLASEVGSKESIGCVIWGGEKQLCETLLEKGFELEAELQVMFAVKVDLNPSRSSLSLSVVGVVAEYTIGKLAALREKTNARLKEEGLFEKNQKQALPLLPVKLGILTSAGGTVINDFKSSLDEAEFGFKLLWYPVSVQGSAAKQEIKKGIKFLSSIKDLDAILLFRGGGSVADLMVFNEYEVAKAICKCPVPVISAIGHQEDQSSAQDVSFQALGVPKDLGRYFADRIESLRESFLGYFSDIVSLTGESVEEREEELASLAREISVSGSELIGIRGEECRSFETYLPSMAAARLSHVEVALAGALSPVLPLCRGIHQSASSEFSLAARVLRETVASRRVLLTERLRSLSGMLRDQIEGCLCQTNLKVTSFEQVFRELGPESQLKRGFVMVRKEKDLVSSGASLVKDDRLSLIFHDQTRKVTVED